MFAAPIQMEFALDAKEALMKLAIGRNIPTKKNHPFWKK